MHCRPSVLVTIISARVRSYQILALTITYDSRGKEGCRRKGRLMQLWHMVNCKGTSLHRYQPVPLDDRLIIERQGSFPYHQVVSDLPSLPSSVNPCLPLSSLPSPVIPPFPCHRHAITKTIGSLMQTALMTVANDATTCQSFECCGVRHIAGRYRRRCYYCGLTVYATRLLRWPIATTTTPHPRVLPRVQSGHHVSSKLARFMNADGVRSSYHRSS